MNFVAFACNECGSLFIQKKYLCPSCRNDSFHEQEISGKGTVYTYTTIHVSSPDYQHLTPYNIVLIQLEHGLKITGRLYGKVSIDNQVQLSEREDGAYIFEKL